MGRRESGLPWPDMQAVSDRQSYSSGCFSGNLDWLSSVARLFKPNNSTSVVRSENELRNTSGVPFALRHESVLTWRVE
jgi:hypothetical protein